MLDPSLAPGYLAWVVNDGEHAHVGVAGYPHRFPDGMRRALHRFHASAPGLPAGERPDDVERRGGPIPVGGLLHRISSPLGLLVGDAAGAVSPLTAGGLDPCLRLSEHAVDVLDDALRRGRRDALTHYDGAALRARFRGRLALRRGLAQVRTPAVATAAFAALRTPVGRGRRPARPLRRPLVPDDRTRTRAADERRRQLTCGQRRSRRSGASASRSSSPSPTSRQGPVSASSTTGCAA